jgi:hypothetical protein
MNSTVSNDANAMDFIYTPDSGLGQSPEQTTTMIDVVPAPFDIGLSEEDRRSYNRDFSGIITSLVTSGAGFIVALNYIYDELPGPKMNEFETILFIPTSIANAALAVALGYFDSMLSIRKKYRQQQILDRNYLQ